MASIKVNITFKAMVKAVSIMLISAVPLQAHAFIFLLPLLAGDGGDPMKATDVIKALVGNTVVAEKQEGTAYVLMHADGGGVGIHPEHGKLDGNWNVDNDGKICFTWRYPSGSITNCANVVDLGEGKYKWGDQAFSVEQGDVKNLNNK